MDSAWSSIFRGGWGDPQVTSTPKKRSRPPSLIERTPPKNKKARKTVPASAPGSTSDGKKAKSWQANLPAGCVAPANAYGLWMRGNRSRISKDIGVKDFGELARTCSALWNEMSFEEKKPWFDEQDRVTEQYNKAKAAAGMKVNAPKQNRHVRVKSEPYVPTFDAEGLELSPGRLGGYRNVSFHTLTGKWTANVTFEGRSRYLGVFATPVEAARKIHEARQRIKDSSWVVPDPKRKQIKPRRWPVAPEGSKQREVTNRLKEKHIANLTAKLEAEGKLDGSLAKRVAAMSSSKVAPAASATEPTQQQAAEVEAAGGRPV